MKIGIIIPDRNDRPLFLANCLRLIDNQTLKPTIVEIVNYPAKSDAVDITERYRYGYDKLRNMDLDVIALMENDEWYSPDYLQIMCDNWVKNDKPDIFGTNYTIYYHIKLFAMFTMHHLTRSSAMSTLIKPDLNFDWCADNEPYTDIHLWKTLKGVCFSPYKTICLGIKHGVGKCGGFAHTDKLHRYENELSTKDTDKEILRNIVDAKSFKFYSEYFDKTITINELNECLNWLKKIN